MEEEAARQAAANAPPPAQGAAGAGAAAGSSDASAQASQQAPAATTDPGEEALLQQALALSENRAGAGADVEMAEEGGGDETLTEEEMIARAIEMSMHPEQESEENEQK